MQFLFGDYRLDTERRELHHGATPVALEPQVFDVLVHLVENRNRVVASVVCVMLSTGTVSSRWNSNNQQFRLYASITIWNQLAFIVQRLDGCAAKPASLLASLIKFSAEARPR